MSMSLKDFKKSVKEESITDKKEIMDICSQLLQLKLKDFVPDDGVTERTAYNYVVSNMLKSFKVDTEKYIDVMSLEEFIVLFLIALEHDDFRSPEDTLFIDDFHATRCFRDLQVQKLAEAMLSASNNSVINRFLRINLIAYVDMVWKCKNHTSEAVVTEEIYAIIASITKQPVERNMTLRDAFELSKKESYRPWLPGCIPLFSYVINAKKNVHFVSMLLVDCLNKLFEIEKKYDAWELVEKYRDAIEIYEEDTDE